MHRAVSPSFPDRRHELAGFPPGPFDSSTGGPVRFPLPRDPPRLVVLESPYAGCDAVEVGLNVRYARRALADSLSRGEAPIASHLLYTQPGVLRDSIPEERAKGIEAGFAWARLAEAAVFYVDRGWSAGMIAARNWFEGRGMPIEVRELGARA